MKLTEELLAPEKTGVSARIYLEPLTGLRGVAAVWVALWHLWGFAGRPAYQIDIGGLELDLTPLVRIGWAGVDIFFVLSGFVLGLAWCQARLGHRPPLRLGDYFRRRVLRVVPALWAQMAILVLVALWAGSRLPPAGELLAQALLAHNLIGTPQGQLNPVYWTLPVEFDFYLILPLLALAVHPRRWPWLLAASLALVAAYRWSVFHQLPAGATVGDKVWRLNQLPGRLDQFVAGMTAAWLFLSAREGGRAAWLHRHRHGLLAAGTAGFLALAWYIHIRQPMAGVPLAGLTYWQGHWSLFVWNSAAGLCLAAVILAIALGTRLTDRLLANPLVLFLGVISYSLYLWHFPVIRWLHGLGLPRLFPDWPLAEGLLWCTPPILAASTLSYWAVERPFLRWRHRQSPTKN